MKNKRRLNFYIDCDTAEDFKIGCIKNHIKMSEFMVKMIEKAVKLGIYVDLSNKENNK